MAGGTSDWAESVAMPPFTAFYRAVNGWDPFP